MSFYEQLFTEELVVAIFRSCIGDKVLGFNGFLSAVLVCGQRGGNGFLSGVVTF